MQLTKLFLFPTNQQLKEENIPINKDWYFPLRAELILWTQSLTQHNMIQPESRVTWLQSPASLEFLLLERLMKYREAQRVAGYLG